MIQFTTISARYVPSAVYRSGRYAFISIWIMVTKPAIITMYAGIRTLSGITLRSADIAMLEQIRTIAAAIPILSASDTEAVTARVGQVPRTSTNTGFYLMKPFNIMESLLCFSILLSLLYCVESCCHVSGCRFNSVCCEGAAG